MDNILKDGEVLEGHYKIDHLIASGGFSQVYQAIDLSLLRTVVIRILIDLDPDMEKQFLEEARKLANLEHENIVKIYMIGSYRKANQSYPFMVMELASNGTLRNAMDAKRGKAYSSIEMLEIIEPVANALEEAHDNDLIHLDVTPNNILFGKNKKPILADFGLVQQITGTKTSIVVPNIGTPGYAAYEVYLGKANKQSDQYSLAAIIYEMLTVNVPDGETGDTETGAGIVNIELHSYPKIEKVLLKALQKDYHKRFISVKEFMDELEKAIYIRHKFKPLSPGPVSASVSFITDPYNRERITAEIIADAIDATDNPYVHYDKWGEQPFYLDNKLNLCTSVPKNGAETMQLLLNSNNPSFGLVNKRIFRDFAFQVVIRASGRGEFLIGFRANGKSEYVIQGDTDLSFGRKWLYCSCYMTGVQSKKIKIAKFNDNAFLLGIVAQKNTIDIYADLRHITRITDSTFDAGGISIKARIKRDYPSIGVNPISFSFVCRNMHLWEKK